MRSRLTSARALWKVRISRRSSGWSTIAAIVDRKRAGEGLRLVLRSGVARGGLSRAGGAQQQAFI
jgi:hypothetical protein